MILALTLCLICLFTIGCNNKNEEKQVFGVWWWDNRLGQEYFDFAESSGVNEIYYYDSDLGNKSSEFITQANRKNIDVYLLIGDYQWLYDFEQVYEKVDDFVEYNLNNPSATYKGIHLDIEPHQDENFDNEDASLNTREMLIYNLIDLASNLNDKYPNVHFEYDIPFWLHDEIEYNGYIKPAYAHMIDIADRIFLMSYRDSASGMLDVSKEELEYGKQAGKPIILGAETSDQGQTDQIVTYYEEGQTYMNSQLEIVLDSLPNSYGISIHHIRSWYEL